jgi:hypothetical protein
MRRNAFQLSRRHKVALYLVTVLVFASGVGWWICDRLFSIADEFGGVEHPAAQATMLKVHGAAAMALLVLLGTLLPIHVKHSWVAGHNRPTGAGLLAWFGVLTLTGYGLYYAAGEELRAWTSAVHWWVGVALPLGLVAHVWRGHWLRRHGRLRPRMH